MFSVMGSLLGNEGGEQAFRYGEWHIHRRAPIHVKTGIVAVPELHMIVFEFALEAFAVLRAV